MAEPVTIHVSPEIPMKISRSVTCAIIAALSAAALCWCAILHIRSGGNSEVGELVGAIERGEDRRAIELVSLGLADRVYHPPHFQARWCLPIHIAVMSGNHRVLAFLLASQGVDPNARDFEGRTPMMYIYDGFEMRKVSDYLKCLEALIKAHADVNAASLSGQTTLHLMTHPTVVTEFLLRAGADPNRKDALGNTPLHRACAGIRLGPDGAR